MGVVVGCAGAISHTGSSTVIRKVPNGALQYAYPLSPIHELVGRWDPQAGNQASPGIIVGKCIWGTFGDTGSIHILCILIHFDAAPVDAFAQVRVSIVGGIDGAHLHASPCGIVLEPTCWTVQPAKLRSHARVIPECTEWALVHTLHCGIVLVQQNGAVALQDANS